MFEQVTTANEVAETATELRDIATVNGIVTREHQVWMLTHLFNGGLNLLQVFGAAATVIIDGYRKQTSAAPRIEGRTHVRMAGMRSDAHVGQVTKAWRTKKGDLVLRLYDHNRQPTPEALAAAEAAGKKPPQPYTCVRIEGIRSILPGVPFAGF